MLSKLFAISSLAINLCVQDRRVSLLQDYHRSTVRKISICLWNAYSFMFKNISCIIFLAFSDPPIHLFPKKKFEKKNCWIKRLERKTGGLPWYFLTPTMSFWHFLTFFKLKSIQLLRICIVLTIQLFYNPDYVFLS